jgi:DNA-directed RNA polymerase specialized sigma24 family protein
MNIDVKKLLYNYPKLKVALMNIRESQNRLNKQIQRPKCTAGYNDDVQGKGGLPSSTTERMALFNVELYDQHYWLDLDAEEYVYAIQLVTTALETLSERQRELIKLSYFEEREPIIVSDKLHIGLSRFYHLHKIAIDGIEQCLNSGNIFMNRLIPTKNNKSSNKNTRIYAKIS